MNNPFRIFLAIFLAFAATLALGQVSGVSGFPFNPSFGTASVSVGINGKNDFWIDVEDTGGSPTRLINFSVSDQANFGSFTDALRLRGTGDFKYTNDSGSTQNIVWHAGNSFAKFTSCNFTVDPPSIGAGLTNITSQTCTGAATGSACMVNLDSTGTGLIPHCYVSSANTLTLKLANHTSGSVDLSSKTYRAVVIAP